MSESNLPQPVETEQAPVPDEPINPWARNLYFDPDVERHPAVRVIREHFPGAILDIVRFRDETALRCRGAALLAD